MSTTESSSAKFTKKGLRDVAYSNRVKHVYTHVRLEDGQYKTSEVKISNFEKNWNSIPGYIANPTLRLAGIAGVLLSYLTSKYGVPKVDATALLDNSYTKDTYTKNTSIGIRVYTDAGGVEGIFEVKTSDGRMLQYSGANQAPARIGAKEAFNNELNQYKEYAHKSKALDDQKFGLEDLEVLSGLPTFDVTVVTVSKKPAAAAGSVATQKSPKTTKVYTTAELAKKIQKARSGVDGVVKFLDVSKFNPYLTKVAGGNKGDMKIFNAAGSTHRLVLSAVTPANVLTYAIAKLGKDGAFTPEAQKGIANYMAFVRGQPLPYAAAAASGSPPGSPRGSPPGGLFESKSAPPPSSPRVTAPVPTSTVAGTATPLNLQSLFTQAAQQRPTGDLTAEFGF